MAPYELDVNELRDYEDAEKLLSEALALIPTASGNPIESLRRSVLEVAAGNPAYSTASIELALKRLKLDEIRYVFDRTKRS